MTKIMSDSKVVDFNGITTLPTSANRVLERALDQDLDVVVIVGFDKDGNEYFDSTTPDAAETVWHLQRGIWRLNKTCDELSGDE